VALKEVLPGDELMMVTRKGVIIRVPVEGIRVIGRNTQGVRVMNLDPGYVSLSKLVLASTKDYTHRIYLGDGIFAEVTMHYANGRFNSWPWTYPDYKTEDYRRFFDTIRSKYRAVLRKTGS